MLAIGYGLCPPAVPSKTYLFSPYWSAEAAAGPAFSPAGFPAIQEARQNFFNPNSFSCSHPAVGQDYRAVLSCQKRSRQIISEKYCLFMPVICRLCNNNIPPNQPFPCKYSAYSRIIAPLYPDNMQKAIPGLLFFIGLIYYKISSSE